jgi:hypothetical protein
VNDRIKSTFLNATKESLIPRLEPKLLPKEKQEKQTPVQLDKDRDKTNDYEFIKAKQEKRAEDRNYYCK